MLATKLQTKPGRTVLVVDDNAALRSTVGKSFLSDGFVLCPEAENGLRAIAVAIECNPDVIVLDLAMPVLNGLETAPKLHALFPHVPIILFTLHGDMLRDRDLSQLGISATFSKSESLDGLLAKAHQLMEDRYPTH